MLTEEDLDYIFENEFPQWLEEGLTIRHLTPKEQAKRDKERRERIRKETLENEKKPMV